MTAFEIEFHRNGTLYQKFRVPSRNGKPSSQPILAMIDARLQKAFLRGQWEPTTATDVKRRDLVGVSGKPLGTIFARRLDIPA